MTLRLHIVVVVSCRQKVFVALYAFHNSRETDIVHPWSDCLYRRPQMVSLRCVCSSWQDVDPCLVQDASEGGSVAPINLWFRARCRLILDGEEEMISKPSEAIMIVYHACRKEMIVCDRCGRTPRYRVLVTVEMVK